MQLIRKSRLEALEIEEQCARELRRTLDEQTKKHDRDIAQLGRQLADRDEEIGKLRTHNHNLRQQVDAAVNQVASARSWINNLITGDPDDDYPETAGTGVSLVKRGPA
jgi:predicted  nucleic acid-binding Zn-ribbon protein